jgi:glyoxylase-like metal-dependent hydrolase (beta-lactamase superfamily II)
VDVGTTTGFEIIQISTPGLGDHSYVLRSGAEAAIVDPQRDADRFQQVVRELEVRVVAVVETHLHNDYVSGGPTLAAQYNAPYVVPAEAGYDLPHHPVRDGDEIGVGAVRLRALHTPGHTPHHMSYEVVEDGRVRAVFSGGFPDWQERGYPVDR